jgi:hypothetical protein
MYPEAMDSVVDCLRRSGPETQNLALLHLKGDVAHGIHIAVPLGDAPEFNHATASSSNASYYNKFRRRAGNARMNKL